MMGRKLPKEEQGQYSLRTLGSELELLGNKGEKSASVRSKDVDSTQGLRDRNHPQDWTVRQTASSEEILVFLKITYRERK